MSVRVYTLLTPGQKAELVKLAATDDRSVSYLIARAIDEFIDKVDAVRLTSDSATEKVFTRTTFDVALSVKDRAHMIACHDWQVVNECVENYLEKRN